VALWQEKKKASENLPCDPHNKLKGSGRVFWKSISEAVFSYWSRLSITDSRQVNKILINGLL
jgi:hypothetical protein